MELEAYEDVAVRELEKIAAEATEKFRLLHVDVIHRIGRLVVGENILIILVSARHREEAYGGSRYIIEAIKAGVPIWKKELTKDGGRWVPGEHAHGSGRKGGMD
jgi:molybdopterin synthase catalytic subunit